MIFIGVDWAEAHHDVHVQDENGKRLAGGRLPEGVEGAARFHGMRMTRESRHYLIFCRAPQFTPRLTPRRGIRTSGTRLVSRSRPTTSPARTRHTAAHKVTGTG